MYRINGISYYLSNIIRRYQTRHIMTFFFFQENSAQVHCACNTVQLSEKYDFRVSRFCQVVHKHKLFEVAYSLLIAYFIGNISAKKYQNPFMLVRVIANQRWDVFETQRVMVKCCKKLSCRVEADELCQ